MSEFLEFLIASKPNVTKLASTSSCFKSFCWKFEIRWLFVIYFNLVCYTLKWGRSVQCDSCDVKHLGLGGGNSSGIILNRAKINLISAESCGTLLLANAYAVFGSWNCRRIYQGNLRNALYAIGKSRYIMKQNSFWGASKILKQITTKLMVPFLLSLIDLNQQVFLICAQYIYRVNVSDKYTYHQIKSNASSKKKLNPMLLHFSFYFFIFEEAEK